MNNAIEINANDLLKDELMVTLKVTGVYRMKLKLVIMQGLCWLIAKLGFHVEIEAQQK